MPSKNSSLRKYYRLITVLVVFGLFLGIVNKLNVQALYYGTPTTAYPQSGYMFADLGNDRAGQCGINYVSDKVAITAAHCMDEAKQIYAGTGNYVQGFGNNSPRVNYFKFSPDYNETDYSFNPGMADVGVVVFSEPVKVSQYAFITSPKATCNYYLVGYGKNQKGSNFDRTGTDVCIKNISEHAFELTFSGNANFCVGDSGSGIYEKNSNNVVGLVSAYYNNRGDQGCDNAVAYIATRLDTNLDFLSQHIPSSAYKKDVPPAPETVPDDYFDDYYPETKEDDGTYNYENEIILEIEKLKKLFEDIYPEDEENNGTSVTPIPPDGSDDDEDYEYYEEIDNPDYGEDTSNETEDLEVTTTDWVITLSLCICCILIVLGFFVMIILLTRKKKTPVQPVTPAATPMQ